MVTRVEFYKDLALILRICGARPPVTLGTTVFSAALTLAICLSSSAGETSAGSALLAESRDPDRLELSGRSLPAPALLTIALLGAVSAGAEFCNNASSARASCASRLCGERGNF